MKKLYLQALPIALLMIVSSVSPGHAEPAKRPILVAHRGANRLADENTLKAYSLAADYGVDYIECDPRLSRDGALVISHDDSVARMTGATGLISEMPFDEIRKLRTLHGEQIPTLEEVLILAKKRNVGVYLDTKIQDISYIEKLIALVEKTGMSDRVIVGLWWSDVQKWMKKNHPEIKTSLSWPAPVPSLKQIKKIGASWVGAMEDKATKDFIGQCNAAGLLLITMPINDEAAIREKIANGIPIVQTDDPALLRKIIDDIFGPDKK
jgi:glycerophosphoryl diester phosphodiesterase